MEVVEEGQGGSCYGVSIPVTPVVPCQGDRGAGKQLFGPPDDRRYEGWSQGHDILCLSEVTRV